MISLKHILRAWIVLKRTGQAFYQNNGYFLAMGLAFAAFVYFAHDGHWTEGSGHHRLCGGPAIARLYAVSGNRAAAAVTASPLSPRIIPG